MVNEFDRFVVIQGGVLLGDVVSLPRDATWDPNSYPLYVRWEVVMCATDKRDEGVVVREVYRQASHDVFNVLVSDGHKCRM